MYKKEQQQNKFINTREDLSDIQITWLWIMIIKNKHYYIFSFTKINIGNYEF